jgi:hypothetical protein
MYNAGGFSATQFWLGNLNRDYIFDKQSKSHRLTVAILGALPSRRRVDEEILRCETRRRDASAPGLALPIPSPVAFRQAFRLASGVVLFVKGIIPGNRGEKLRFETRFGTISPKDWTLSLPPVADFTQAASKTGGGG